MSEAQSSEATEAVQSLEAELEEHKGEVERLAAENERLRREYDRAQHVTYRRTAFGLAIVGVIGIVASVVFPTVRTVLLILGGIGVFSGILTYYLTPERFIPASIGERVYVNMAESRAVLVNELGLTDRRVYVTAPDGSATKLYVPLYREARLPDWDELESVLVIGDKTDSRGVSFNPTGEGLYEEFERMVQAPIGETPEEIGRQLIESLVEGLELAGRGTIESDPDGEQLTIRIRENVYGRMDRFDHPVISFIGVGLARGFGRPVELVDVDFDPDDDEAIVTFRWID